MRRIIPFLVIAALAGHAVAEEGTGASPRSAVVESTPRILGQRVVFRSEILSTDVSMNIYLPDSFELSSAEHTYPVIFINGEHGNQFFSTLVGIVKHLGDRERIPESIVVSLNDMGETPDIYTNGMWGRDKIEGSPDSQRSLRHLENEVIPYLEKHYRANDYRLIIGVSGSCLFPIYSFTEAPELFDSHILIAAADMMGMGYQPKKTFLDAFQAALQKTPTRAAKLYVGVADSDLEKRPDYQANLDAVATRFERFERVDVKTEVVANADHYAVFIKSMLSALDQNFPKARWSSRYRDLVAQPGDALANLDQYYAELSRTYGFKILPRADRWNNVNCLRFIIRHLIREGRASEAVSVARRRIEYRPRSAASFSGLADALEADGRLDAAIEAQEKAIALATTASSEEAEDLASRLQVLKNAS